MRAPACLAVAVVAVAGCGTSAAHHPRRRPPSPIAQAQVMHEYRSAPAPQQEVSGGSRSPSVAVAAFAVAYINWDADTVSADMRALASRSVGQARAATQLASAETAGDYELQRDGIANNGTIEAIAPLPGRADQYVVVTKEWTTATGTTAYQGLQPAWHVAVATAIQVGPGEWVVSKWQPQS